MNPKYVITLGNQHDLTVGDYLGYLADDDALRVFACYVEGFRPDDGIRFMRTAMDIVDSGRTVVLYRAGRTADGARASSSHTASVAGDYAVARSLACHAGVVVSDSLAEFTDLTRLFAWLGDKRVAGMRLGAMSNAGFECVAFADNLGGFVLPAYTATTRETLDDLLRERRLSGIVEARNPLDVTPILEDEAFERAARAVIADDGVDVGVIGCVPLSGALHTVPAGEDHREDVRSDFSVARRLGRLHRESRKAWVCVVDGGPRYDAMAGVLESLRVPTFRSADRALRVFGRFCRSRLGS